MAKNLCGFILKRYTQPVYYKEFFCLYNAIYFTKSGKEIMIEACPSIFVGEKLGAGIEYYNILMQEPTHRKMLRSRIPSQKKAVELIEKFIEKY